MKLAKRIQKRLPKIAHEIHYPIKKDSPLRVSLLYIFQELYIRRELFFRYGYVLALLFSVVDDHTRNCEDDLNSVSDQRAEGHGADIVKTPESHVYKSPEAVLFAALLTNAHDKGQRRDDSKDSESRNSAYGEIKRDECDRVQRDEPCGQRLHFSVVEIVYNRLNTAEITGSSTVDAVTGKQVAGGDEHISHKNEQQDLLHILSLDERSKDHRHKSRDT